MKKRIVGKHNYWTPFPLAPFPGATESHITRRVFWLRFPRWQHSYRVDRMRARPSDRKRLDEGWARFKVWSDQKEKERRQGKEGVNGDKN